MAGVPGNGDDPEGLSLLGEAPDASLGGLSQTQEHTMAIRKQRNIPVPTTQRPAQNTGEITEVMQSLEEGESFFVPAGDEKPSLVQRRITVRGAQMRESGKIDFYLVTRQVREDWENDDGEVIANTPGVRVWRRPADANLVAESTAEESTAS